METYEDRKQLLQYLNSQVSILNIGLWCTIQELKFHHNRMLNRYKMSESDLKEMEKNYKTIIKDGPILREGFYEEALPKMRNPQ